MRLLLTLIFSLLLLAPTATWADAVTGTCPDRKTSAEVGVFMQNICDECWEQGNCSINDFMTVLANTGNYILTIVAALVFLMYVLGAFWWIISHGDTKLVQKGKDYIKFSTVGLIIVLVAYTGVVALRSAITSGTLSEGYVICAGDETEGLSCARNSECLGFSCFSKCEKKGGSCVSSDDASIINAANPKTDTCAVGTTATMCSDETQWCCEPVVTTPTTP